MKYLLVCLLVLACVIAVMSKRTDGLSADNEEGSKSEIVCEHNSQIISCSNNRKINIKKASYGRTNSDICSGRKTDVTNCHAESTHNVVMNSCNGRNSCTLKATNGLFGDPCYGTKKYLEVEYECLPEIVCETNSQIISCPNNGIISIKKASYGRTRSDICPGRKTDVTNCHAESTHNVVTNSCNGTNSCTLKSSNGLFGDPCYGTTKYLEVEYKCLTGGTDPA